MKTRLFLALVPLLVLAPIVITAVLRQPLEGALYTEILAHRRAIIASQATAASGRVDAALAVLRVSAPPAPAAGLAPVLAAIPEAAQVSWVRPDVAPLVLQGPPATPRHSAMDAPILLLPGAPAELSVAPGARDAFLLAVSVPRPDFPGGGALEARLDGSRLVAPLDALAHELAPDAVFLADGSGRLLLAAGSPADDEASETFACGALLSDLVRFDGGTGDVQVDMRALLLAGGQCPATVRRVLRPGYLVVSPIARAGLALGAFVDPGQAASPFVSVWGLMFGLMALMATILTLVVSPVAAGIVGPLRGLAAATEAIARQEFGTRIEVAGGPDEVVALAGSFNKMAEELSRLDTANKDYVQSLRSLQDQLVQAQKLEAVGRLAAGVAHELNSPLMSMDTSLFTITRLLAKAQSGDARIGEAIGTVREALAHARTVVRDLLDYSRQRPSEAVAVGMDVNEVCHKASALVATTGRRQVEMQLGAVSSVKGDPHQLQQSIINLLSNALDACIEKGSVTLASREDAFSAQERFVMQQTRKAEEAARAAATGPSAAAAAAAAPPIPPMPASDAAVTIEVADTGPGIAPEHLDKIFDPFFTTKPQGKGTGLGLAITLGIVRRHGGILSVRSKLGEGTTFQIKLPAVPPVVPMPQ